MDFDIPSILAALGITAGVGKAGLKVLDHYLSLHGKKWDRANRIEDALMGARVKVIEARSEVTADRIKNEGAFTIAASIEDRALQRADAQARWRQQNLESVVRDTFGQLLGIPDREVSDDPIDMRWLAKFTASAEAVEDDAMRSAWARVLAREAIKPGSFSLRTLAALDVMSKADAMLFTACCRSTARVAPTVESRMVFMMACGPKEGPHAPLTDLRRADVMHLQSIGLLAATEFHWTIGPFSATPTHYDGADYTVSYADDDRLIEALSVHLDEQAPTSPEYQRAHMHRIDEQYNRILSGLPLSHVGRELEPICGAERDLEDLNTRLRLGGLELRRLGSYAWDVMER